MYFKPGEFLFNMKSSEEIVVAPGRQGKLRIAVFGQSQVGKSALTVRYLTKRFIGEYKSNTDMFYHQSLKIQHGSTLEIEIVDISTFENSPLLNPSKWDGIILVYSITDRASYQFAVESLSKISGIARGQVNGSGSPPNAAPPSPPLPPIILTGNKNDLEHLRAVEKSEGLNLAAEHGCHFYELSVSQNSPQVYQVFHMIINNIKPNKRKFSINKILFNISKIGYTNKQGDSNNGESNVDFNSCRNSIKAPKESSTKKSIYS